MGDDDGNGVKASGWNRAMPERPETLMAKRAAAPALSAATLSPARPSARPRRRR